MENYWVSFALRSVFTIALVYGVYRESGIFTVIAFGMIFLQFEIIGYIMRRKS